MPAQVNDRRRRTQRGVVLPAQATDRALGQALPGEQAIDLGGVEGQAGQGEAAVGDGAIAPPALLLQAPALLELAVGVVLDMPTRAEGLDRIVAAWPGACAD